MVTMMLNKGNEEPWSLEPSMYIENGCVETENNFHENLNGIIGYDTDASPRNFVSNKFCAYEQKMQYK